MKKIRVLLVEDHILVRKGLRSLLEDEPELDVIGEASDGHDALQKVGQLNPDVVLMDITMPVLNGLEATRQIKKQYPQTKVLILTMHATEEYVYQTLQAGASGYVVKKSAPDELFLAIQAVYRGDVFLSPSISRPVVSEYLQHLEAQPVDDRFDLLTNREREVLQLIAEGKTNRDVAELLSISQKTARVHRANIMAKLELHTTAELTQYAIRKGMIEM